MKRARRTRIGRRRCCTGGWPPSRASCAREMEELYEEMAQRNTLEAKLYKAIDGLEAVIQHNASDLSTWIPLEYTLNKTYADDKVAFSDYLVHCGRRCGRTPCVSWESSERLCPEKIPCIPREAAGADAPGRLSGLGGCFQKRHGNLTKGWGKTLRAPDTIKPEESETYSKNAGLGGPDRREYGANVTE